MRGRLRSFGIAMTSAPDLLSLMPLVVVPVVLLGWVVGVLLMPDPAAPLVHWLSLLAAAGGIAVLLPGHLLDTLSLRYKYPPIIVAGGTLCILLSAFCLWVEPSWPLLFRLGLPLLLTGLGWFYTFYFSVFHGTQRFSRLQVGDRFPEFALPDSAGRTVTLTAALEKGPAVLLFYKGDW